MRDPDDWRGLEQRHAENLKRLTDLFDDPGRAAAMLWDGAGDRAAGSVSSILLDNATVDHAARYFSGESRRESGCFAPPFPTRSRLVLLAVAEFVNALVLYENVVVGPEGDGRRYAGEGSGPVRAEVRPADERLPWSQIYPLLAVARARAVESLAADPATVDVVAGLLGRALDRAEVSRQVAAITPAATHRSPHKLDWYVDNERYYYADLSVGVLGPTEVALNAVDEANAGRRLNTEYFRYSAARCNARIPEEGTGEHFAAHLIYRVHVYLLMADLLGCAYSADALRSGIVRHLARPGRGQAGRFADRVVGLVGSAQRARDEQASELLGYPAFTARIPLVFKHVLSRARRPEEVLDIALDTRDSRPARRFREYCARVDEAIARGDRGDVERSFGELAGYGVRLDAELPGARPESALPAAVDAAKELVSVGSPLLGAVLPGLALSAERARRWSRRRRFAFVEQLIRVPRTLNEIEWEFEHLWPDL